MGYCASIGKDGKMKLHTHVFGGMVLLACSLHLFAKVENDSIQRVDAKNVQVICLNDERKRPFAELWDRYKASSLDEYRQLLATLMTEREKTEVTDSIDREICASFEAEPSSTNALFLGLCTSERSRRLLLESKDHPDPAVRDSVRLALARRGDSDYARQFIQQYQASPISRKLTVALAKDREATKTVRRLEYIGTPDALTALFDGAASHALAEEPFSGSNRVIVHSTTLQNFRDFMIAMGVSIPDTVSTGRELANWWKENRERLVALMRQKGSTLPRIRGTRFGIGYL